jgi:hypothetical protein
MATNRIKTGVDWILRMIKYNLKIIFANKFIWFLLAALAIFVLATLITLFDGNMITSRSVFNLLLFPGLLLIFYPTAFGIQNDEDTRILEILFGIPDYRYKVWLVRLILIFLLVFFVLLVLSSFSSWAMVKFEVFKMAYSLMLPILFMGSLAFLLSTVIKNGIGTAVVIIIIAIVLLTLSDAISHSKWNIFLNPFFVPDDISEAAWATVIHDNHVILFVGIIVTVLLGLLGLQRREKFI